MTRPDDGPEPVILSGDITVATVEELRARLLAHLETNVVSHLDAAAVLRIDAAGAQLLYAFVREVQGRGGAVHWIDPSSALLATACTLGLHAALQLP